MGLATAIGKAYLKSGGTKTDELLAKGAKGVFKRFNKASNHRSGGGYFPQKL